MNKKSLKIPKVCPITANKRSICKTMAKIKRTKGQTTVYKSLHRKLQIEQHEPTKNMELTQMLRKGEQLMPH